MYLIEGEHLKKTVLSMALVWKRALRAFEGAQLPYSKFKNLSDSDECVRHSLSTEYKASSISESKRDTCLPFAKDFSPPLLKLPGLGM